MSISYIFLACFILVWVSCKKMSSPDSKMLLFSGDTIYFDTVFSSIGSTTKELRVINPGKENITINRIYLAGGQLSQFRLNIDGEATFEKENIEIEGGDSIFIFIDVIIDPSDASSPLAVTDSIIFITGNEIQKVQLLAWGQDIILIDDRTINTDIWHKGKPYLVYNNVMIDTSGTLNIEEGTKVYFHRNSSVIVAGKIVVNGSRNSPVLFAGDRLEKMYEDVPGQWKGIYILNTSKGNRINYSIIRNTIYGIKIGETTFSAEIPELKIFSSFIMHATVSGLSVINGNIEAANCIFAHCGKNCISLSSGGEFSFTHCTIFNRWDYGLRLTPSLYVSEKPEKPGGPINPIKLDFGNCVIYGDNASEINIVPINDNFTSNYYFDHCLIKLDTLYAPFWNKNYFPETTINRNPLFIDLNLYDFRPDTLSPLINHGSKVYSANYPVDIRGVSRISDSLPDIGAFEWIPGDHKINK